MSDHDKWSSPPESSNHKCLTAGLALFLLGILVTFHTVVSIPTAWSHVNVRARW